MKKRMGRKHRQNHQDLCESGISRRKPEAEIRRFRKENKQLEMEHEIFEKGHGRLCQKVELRHDLMSTMLKRSICLLHHLPRRRMIVTKAALAFRQSNGFI